MERTVPDPRVKKLRCRYCGELIELNEDSDASRQSQSDPFAQMRAHVAASHKKSTVDHVARMAGLMDCLMFDAPDNPERWRENLGRLTDYLLRQSIQANL